MIKPIRIQMKRIKGFDLQNYSLKLNGLKCIIVSRPTKWGNPIKLDGDCIYIDASYRRKIFNKWVTFSVGDIYDVLHLYELLLKGIRFHNKDLQYWSDHFKTLDVNELKGANLSCWCPLDQPCHADILLKYANQKQE